MNIFSQKYKEILDNILKLKNENGLTDLALAKNLNLNLGVIDNWKRGKSKSYLKIIPQIAEYFNVTPEYLLGMTVKEDSISVESEADKTLPSIDPKHKKIISLWDKLDPVEQARFQGEILGYLKAKEK